MDYISPAVKAAAADGEIAGALAELLREGLEERGRLRLHLQGDSMWPTIPPGSLVEVERLFPDDLRPGNIVIWLQGGKFVAHRIVEVRRRRSGNVLVTKGDNASSSDRLLSPGQVIGRVARILESEEVGLESRKGAAFWLWRWRVRSLLGRAGGLLPRRMRSPLIWLRDRLGRWLSLGFRAAFLR